jgi:predicted DsbA family dithiol-disulfide isomerase
MKKVKLEIFSDYVCPFCWLAEPAAQALTRTDQDIEVVWRAFELRPEPVPTLDPNGEYPHRVWRDSVYPLAKRVGMTLRLPPVQPRSRHAHAAAHWAREHGHFDEYHAALFRVFFERGENIGEVDILVGLAQELKLDGEALRVALDSREYEGRVVADEREAEALGIRGVPAFVADRRALLSGVHPVEDLKELIARVRRNGRGDER